MPLFKKKDEMRNGKIPSVPSPTEVDEQVDPMEPRRQEGPPPEVQRLMQEAQQAVQGEGLLCTLASQFVQATINGRRIPNTPKLRHDILVDAFTLAEEFEHARMQRLDRLTERFNTLIQAALDDAKPAVTPEPTDEDDDDLPLV